MNTGADHDAPARATVAARRRLPAVVAACLVAVAVPVVAVALDVRLEMTDGAVVSGVLESISEREVRLAAQAAVPVAAVRRVVVNRPADGAGREPPARVTVVGADGLRLTGDDFLCANGRATILRDAGRIELPSGLVRTVAFRAEGRGDLAAAWMAAIPESPAGDLVVVARQQDKEGPGFELVECAISAVDAEQVAVVLDEETIRVNRGKVVGLHWLRPAAAAAAGTAVEVAGGGLRGGSVAWTPESLEIDGVVKLPGRMLRTIDYAAGRTVQLATLTAERTTVEPFFGGLVTLEGGADFFAPRFLPPAAANAGGLVVRPRTVVVWRVPADSRRFRARLSAGAAEGRRPAEVTILADDREVFRSPAAGREPAAADEPIDVDVATARRLTIRVDFAAGAGPVGPVLFHDPAFER